MGPLPGVHEAFGLRYSTDLELPLGPGPARGAADVHLRAAARSEVEAAFSGPSSPARVHTGDAGGVPFTVERGRAGDHLLTLEAQAWFHLDPAARVVRAAATRPADPEWKRFLLDTVLGTVSLIHGFEVLHAAAIGTTHGLVAVMAPTGGGKTSVLVELLGRGGTMFADDLLALSRQDGAIVGHPGPPLMNVPAEAASGATVIARFGDECWVAVDRARLAPAPVRAVVVLDRAGTGPPNTGALPASASLLLAQSLDSGRDRLRERFDLFSDLAEQAFLVHVTCPPSLHRSEVADLVEHAVTATAAGR